MTHLFIYSGEVVGLDAVCQVQPTKITRFGHYDVFCALKLTFMAEGRLKKKHGCGAGLHM